MYCNTCGRQNPDNATTCGACGASLENPYGAPTGPPSPPQQINNYLVPAIIATLCCCPPFGVVSIVYAAQVNAFLAGGKVDSAVEAARNAKIWFWVAFGVAAVPWTLYIVFTILMVAIGVMADQR